MALPGRGDSTRETEGRIPVVATIAERRREAVERAIAIGMEVSGNVRIVHALLASTGHGINARAPGSPALAVSSSVEREIVRFIAFVSDSAPRE